MYNLPAVASNWFDKKWLMTEKQKRKIEEMIFSKLPGLSKNNKNVLYALFLGVFKITSAPDSNKSSRYFLKLSNDSNKILVYYPFV